MDDHERLVATAKFRAKVIGAWKRVNALLSHSQATSRDRRLLRQAGVLVPASYGGIVWAEAAVNARSTLEMLKFLRAN